jgi:hypothetical protein
MGYQALLVDRADGIATVTINRPEARNALDLTMREEMLGALDEIERDSAVRVMLLTGAGGHFSAGGDVKSMQKKHTAAEGRARVELLNRFVLRLFNFPKPTIAMVDGFAVGAGCNIALGCDRSSPPRSGVDAQDRARSRRRRRGSATAGRPGQGQEMVLTAEIIDTSAPVGLVNRVVPASNTERDPRPGGADRGRSAAGRLPHVAPPCGDRGFGGAGGETCGQSTPPRKTTPRGYARSQRRQSSRPMIRARITGTGMSVPDCVVDNHLLSRCMSTSDEWIVKRTGISERRVSPDTYRMLRRMSEAPDKTAFMRDVQARGHDGNIDSSLTVSDLAVESGRMALRNAGLTPEDLDCLVLGGIHHVDPEDLILVQAV